MKLDDFHHELHAYLHFDPAMDVGRIDPYMTNGLMVRGNEDVKKVGFGVSASIALFAKAKEAGCDSVIVHHSFNFPPHNRFDAIFQNRIAYLIQNDLSLFGYHFLLDAHPDVGNNAQILKTIETSPVKPFFHGGQPWGWIGEYTNNEAFSEIQKRILPQLSKRTIIYDFGPKDIKRVVAISGKGAPSPSAMQELIDEHIDLYITGEGHEWNRELFREAKINFLAGGHYATEVFGVKSLMEKVKTQFPDVTTEWLDLPNDI